MGCFTSKSLERQAKSEGCNITSYHNQLAQSFKNYDDHLVAVACICYGDPKLDTLTPKEQEHKKRKTDVDSFTVMLEKLQTLEMAAEPGPSRLEDTRPGLEKNISSPGKRSNLGNAPSELALQPVTINVDDLMNGLEDDSPFCRSPVKEAKVCPSEFVPRKPTPFDKYLTFHTIEELNGGDGSTTSKSTALPAKTDGTFIAYGIGEQNGYVTEVSKAVGSYNDGPYLVEHFQDNDLLVRASPEPTFDTFATENAKLNAAILSTGHMNSFASGKHSNSKYSTNEKIELTYDIYSKGIQLSNISFRHTISIPHTSAEIPSSQAAYGCVRELSAGNNCLLFDPDLLASYEDALKDINEDVWNAVSDNEKTMKTSERIIPEGRETFFHRDDNRFFVQKTHTERNGDDLMGFRLPLGLHSRKKHDALKNFEKKCPPGGEMTLVLYTTSLRGIQKTFEDCNKVKSILQSFGLSIDERDVSLHLEFLNELRKLLEKLVTVPRLFIKGRYIGDAEEVLKLHEEGTLAEFIEGLPTEVNRDSCEGCGGLRFVPCLECSGSCKIFNEQNKFVRCSDCNENGLIRCPICS